MQVMLRRIALAVVAIAAAVLTWADLAAACSCSDRDERDRLEDGEIGVLGRVIERRERYSAKRRNLDGSPLISAYDYRVRVQRGVGSRFGSRVTVRVPEDGCQPGTFEVGDRFAAFVRKRSYGWLTHGCSVVDATSFERALRPYPRGRGHGRLALLVGGNFGNARLMALDGRGRILGYGFGEGELQRISLCPGAQLAAELVVRRNRVSVALRDLRSLRELWSVPLALEEAQLYDGASTVRCSDASASAVYATAHEFKPRVFERTRIFRIASTGAREVARVAGYAPRLGLQSAYLTDSRRLLAVSLADGKVRRLARLRYYAEPLEESPDGRLLAFHDGERLRLLDLTSGRERSKPMRNAGAIVWLSPDRFFFRRGGEGRVYDTKLRLLRRYPFFRLYHQALVGNRLFGTDGFRLGALNLRSGRRPTLARLPDRGVVALEGVPGGPEVAADPSAPELGFPAANLQAAWPPSAVTTGLSPSARSVPRARCSTRTGRSLGQGGPRAGRASRPPLG
jgi:hypothetical protein